MIVIAIDIMYVLVYLLRIDIINDVFCYPNKTVTGLGVIIIIFCFI